MKRDNSILAKTSIRLRQAGYLRKWLVLGVVIGVVAGLGAVAFTAALRWATEFFLGLAGGYTPPAPAGEGATLGSGSHLVRPWAIPLVVGLGGLISGILVFRFAPEAEGHGTDAAIEAVHHNPEGIRARVTLIKLLASAATIGSGGSAGREGPTAQISAGFGSLLARRLQLSPQDARIAVTVGIGSGIGAIFRAPLGGAVLGAEILYRDDSSRRRCSRRWWRRSSGSRSSERSKGSSRSSARCTPPSSTIPVQLVYYAVLGIVAGLIGRLYAHGFYGTTRLCRTTSRLADAQARSRPASSSASSGWRSPRARDRVRVAPDGHGQRTARHCTVGDPRPAVREDPLHVAVDRLGGLGRDLRARHGDRRLRRSRRCGACSTAWRPACREGRPRSWSSG